jgi:hypothetical protein
VAAGERGLKKGLAVRERTVVLFSDATIVTETPPLRAAWSRRGEPAEVPVTGNRGRRVVFAALNAKSGAVRVDDAKQWNGESFREHLRAVRRTWRGWRIVLFLDRGSPHTAGPSRALAAELGVEVRWLPTACPELNPVEGLWGWLKGRVLCNRQPDRFADTLKRALDALASLTKAEALAAAGVRSGNFWLPT